MNSTKICIRCKTRKLRKYFYLRNKGGNWITAECKTCTNLRRKIRFEKQFGRKLGIRAKRYTNKELAKLKKLYLAGSSYNELIVQFPSRTRHALETKLSELGVANRKNYMLKRQTGIEAIIEILLKKHPVDFTAQAPISRMNVDFLVKGNLVLEVMGSYWHSDPVLYPKGPQYAVQKRIKKHDSARNKKLLELGYSIIYIWEYDIEHRFDELQKSLNVVLDSNIGENNKPISVELLREDTEINNLIT